jgi:hypothetical protein
MLGADPSKLESIKKNLELIKLASSEQHVKEYVDITIAEVNDLIRSEDGDNF